jgi:recombinase/recombinase-like zinc beta ribbon protein/resolvase-like protein
VKTYDTIIRVSRMGDRPESADSTMTVDDQRARATEEIDRVGGRVGREHMALDVSGHTAIDSPAFRAALGRVRAGEADGIAFGYGDRLGRNWWNAGRFFTELERAGGELLIPGSRDDYRTEDGRTRMGIDAVMDERLWWRYKTRGESTADRVIFERGVANVVPYGYQRNGGRDGRGEKIRPDLDGKALVPDPKTAPIVRKVFEERVAGSSWTSIAAPLNATGVPAPRGDVWTVSTLRSIVRNEAYVGVVRYRERRNESAHEALVTRGVFRTAQAARSVQRNGTYAAGVAGGLVRCSSCGGNMVVAGSKKYLTYGCRRQDRGGRCPHPVHITKRIVDELIDREVRAALKGKVGTAPQIALAQAIEEERATQDELSAYVEVASALDRATFERGLTTRRERLDAARDARVAEETRAGLVEELPTPEAYDNSPLEDRRRFAAALIREVIIAPASGGSPSNRVEVRWR